VEEVAYDTARVRRLDALQRLLYYLDISLLSLLWGGAVLLVLLTGRLLFFPKMTFQGKVLLFCALAGFAGSLLGLWAAGTFVAHIFWRVLWAGTAAGYLVALVQNLFQES